MQIMFTLAACLQFFLVCVRIRPGMGTHTYTWNLCRYFTHTQSDTHTHIRCHTISTFSRTQHILSPSLSVSSSNDLHYQTFGWGMFRHSCQCQSRLGQGHILSLPSCLLHIIRWINSCKIKYSWHTQWFMCREINHFMHFFLFQVHVR